MTDKNEKLIGRSARSKIICTSLILSLIFVCFSGYLTYQYMGKTKNQRLLHLKQTVQIARNSIEPILAEYRTQNISMESALEQVRDLIRRMVYNDHIGDNYIFMSSYDGIMLVQPFEPEKEMTDVWDLKDSYDVYIIRALVKAAKSKEGQGYVSYHYQRPGQTSPQEKISFVVGIPELECYIGTGQYMTDLRKGQLVYILKIAGLTAVLLILLFFLVWASMKEIRTQNALLHKAEHELSAIFNNAFQLIGTLTPDGKLTKVNQSALDFIGQDETSVIGKSFWDTPWWQENDIKNRLKKAVHDCSKGLFCRFEVTYSHPNQEIIFIDFSLSPIFDDKGNVVFLLAEGRDMTEQKQAQEDNKRLESMLNQAQKMESVGRLAGGVAHDFNNMLSVILGHTELALLQAGEHHDLYSDLKEIQTAATRSTDITKQLLAFARKQTISPRQLDLNNTVESMLNMLRRLIGENIDLVWKPSAHPWQVKMDPSQIDQILANLCVNARDAIAGVGTIAIETGAKTFNDEYCRQHSGFIPGDFVLLVVSDNGCGMGRDTLNNLFEPFFTTKEVGKGTGLGLATVYGIVKQNNGFINVYSEPGQGSTFKIYLPRLDADETIDKTVPEKKAAAGGTETILLVEDEPAILDITCMMLEREGYSVLSAATPSEAVEKAKNHSGIIDMLMTDVVMPEMNGRDLSGKITDLYPDIRLLFMSGYTANVIVHQGVLDDGVAFIQKPFSIADLTEKVRDVLDRKII